MLEITKDMKRLRDKIRGVSALSIHKILRYSALAYMCAAAVHRTLTIPPTELTLFNILNYQIVDHATVSLIFILLTIAMLIFAGTPYTRPLRARRLGRKFAVSVLTSAVVSTFGSGVPFLYSGQANLAIPILVGGSFLSVLVLLRIRWILAVPQGISRR